MNLTNVKLGDSTPPGAPLLSNRFIDNNGFNFIISDGADPTLKIDVSAGAYQLGKNITNGAYFSADATGNIVTVQAGNAHYMELDAPSNIFHVVMDGGFNFLNLDANSQTYQIGDISSFGNGNNTYLEVNDAVQAIKITNVQEFSDNAAAVTGGLSVGMVYRTGDDLKIVH